MKIASGGQTIAEQYTTYDTAGYLLTSATRILTTSATGTQVWNVTVQTWSVGVLVSSTTAQYPYGYNFGTLFGQPPAADPTWPGNGSANSAKLHSGPPGQSTGRTRPGVGTGDTNHTHTGAPGRQ